MPANSDSTRDAAGTQRLRHDIYSKAAVTRADLSQLILAGCAAGNSTCPEFVDLLAEVATDLLVEQVDPPKYIQQADADWLIAQLRDGSPGYVAEYRMFTDFFSRAVSIPPGLAAFAVLEIEKIVLANGRVTCQDVEALRTIVFAATESSSLHVTREAAEALLRIAHQTADASNDPGFNDLVAKAVGNYLLGIAFHWTPKAAEVTRMEHWLDEKPSFGSFLSHMFGGGAWAKVETTEQQIRTENTLDEKEAAAARKIDANETDWLLTHLTREGRLTSAEVGLLTFLREEVGTLPPSLTMLLDKQAA